MSYLLRYWKEHEDGTLEDGVYHVPNDITEEGAQKLIEEGKAVVWLVPPKVMKENEEAEVEEES